MDKDNIDASLGLVLSLPLLERYRKNGLLQAEIHHAPGYRGRCKGFLHLVRRSLASLISYACDQDQYQRSASMIYLSLYKQGHSKPGKHSRNNPATSF